MLYVSVGGRKGKRRRTIAHASQITYTRADADIPVDVDIVRPPALVMSCTSAACAGVVGQPTDPFGIAPDRKVLPSAAFYGTITSTDSAGVNKLISKWMAVRADNENVYRYGRCFPARSSSEPAASALGVGEAGGDSDPRRDPAASILAMVNATTLPPQAGLGTN